MYKVFFKERVIFLGDRTESLKYRGAVCFWTEGEDMKKRLEAFERDTSHAEVFIVGENTEALFRAFRDCFRYIEAAGGWVWNSNGEFLVIHRLGKWDLPKGKVEKGEDVVNTAVREVTEECGIRGLEVQHELTSTFHTYRMQDKWLLKRTYWFQMQYNGNERLVPQTGESIEKAEWMPFDQIEYFKANTYPSLFEVVNDVKKHLPKKK